jgi:branched-chain amino acid transport system substrate-binding protein
MLASSVAFSASVCAEDGITDDTITIGGLGALTGPGYLYGKIVMDGAEAVYKEVNEAGGIAGRKIIYLRQDDRCEPTAAIAAAKKLIHDDKVFMVHGGGCTNASHAAYPTIKEQNVPWVIFASVGDPLTSPPAAYIFSTALTASIESFAQVAFARQKGATKVAIVSQRDAWGRDRYDQVVAALNKAGVKPVADEEIAADSNETTPQVLRLMQAGADAVVIVLYPKAAAAFLRDSYKVGYKPIMIGQTALGDLPSLAKQTGIPQAMERFFAISHARYTVGDDDFKKWQSYLAKYSTGEPLQVFHVLGIGSAKVVVEVLRRAGRDLTRARLKEVLQSLSGFETGILPGPITCSETDHQCLKTGAWVSLVNDKVVTVDVTTVQK